MTTRTARTGARHPAALLAVAVLALAVLPTPSAATASPVPDPGRGHPYVVRDGKVHPVHPRITETGDRAGAGGVRRGGSRQTQFVWSQFNEDGSGARIMTARGDGTGLRALTANTTDVYDIDPKISPDGRQVLLERDLPDRVATILVGIDGRHERVLDLGCTDPCAADLTPNWTPNGKRFWFTRVIGPFTEVNESAVSAVLWSADLSGQRIRRESPQGLDGVYEEYNARFLPNGERVVLRLRNEDITNVLIKVDHNRREHQLTDWPLAADTHDVSPAVNGPTKGLVVFETYGHERPEGVASAVVTVPSDCPTLAACTSQMTYLTSPTMPADRYEESYNPTFSPDGKRIAYVRAWYDPQTDTGSGDLWTMTWDGHDKRPFAEFPEFDFRPDWGWAAR